MKIKLTKGHVSLGNLTQFYGDNAMRYGGHLWIFGSYLCWAPPIYAIGRWHSAGLWRSRDTTPSNATWIIGYGWRGREQRREIRKADLRSVGRS